MTAITRLKAMKQKAKAFWKNEDGIGTLEVLLIIAVIVAIFLLFRTFIMEQVEKLMSRAGGKIEEATK